MVRDSGQAASYQPPVTDPKGQAITVFSNFRAHGPPNALFFLFLLAISGIFKF